MAEALVLELVRGTNRPYNVQSVADMLATKGVKKTAAEKALEALVEQGKLVRKEFGKQKLYFPNQEGLAALSSEEQAARREENKRLEAEVRAEEEKVAALRRQLAASNSSLTLEELREQVAQLQAESERCEHKLAGLRTGARLISAQDVAAVEKAYQTLFDAWARYRRQFRAVWNTVSEGMEGKEEALFEEIGIESDKAVGADFEGARALLQPIKKLKR